MHNINRLFGKHIKYAFDYSYILPRAAINYFKLIILRTNVLRGLEFALTYECNSSCSHCSCKKLPQSEKKMLSLNAIKSVVDQALKQGVLQINLTGGEALYHPHILDIVEYIGKKKVVLSVATNGFLLDRKMAKALSSRNVRIVTISIDSADPEKHDNRHNFPGSFKNVFKAVENSIEAGMKVFLCTICTKENMNNGDMWNMINLAKKHNVTITLNLACPVGEWQGNNNVLLDEKDMKEYRKMLTLPHVRWEGGSNYIKEGCPAGVEKIYVSPSGEIMPCPRVHVSYGNIKDNSLKNIWKDMTALSSPFNSPNYDYKDCPAGNNLEFIEKYIC